MHRGAQRQVHNIVCERGSENQTSETAVQRNGEAFLHVYAAKRMHIWPQTDAHIFSWDPGVTDLYICGEEVQLPRMQERQR